LAASAWRPLAAALQDKEASRFGESPLPWRAVALSAHALLAAAGYAFARRAGLGRHAAFAGAALCATAAGHLPVLASAADQGELVGGALLVGALALVARGAASPALAVASSLAASALLVTAAWLALRHRALGAEHLAALQGPELAAASIDARLYAMARALLDALAR